MITGTKGLGTGGVGADHPNQFDARHAFHHPVQHHHIGICLAQGGPGAIAAIGLEDLHDAEGLEDGDDELAHVDIVVHDENLQPLEPVATHCPSTHALLRATPRLA